MNIKFIKYAIWVMIGARILQSLTLSAIQYNVWKKDALMSFSLPPHQSIKYFLGYSWTHFFAGVALSIGTALIFYFILKIIKKYREEIFEEGELGLALVCALIVGWPNTILFISLSFIMLLVISVVRQVFFKEQFATITLPLLISLPVVFIFGQKLIQILHLEALIM